MASNEVLVGLEISQRTHQIQVKTMQRGKGRHMSYPTLLAAPEAIRGEALELLLAAVKAAGYNSLTQLDNALTAPLAQPHEDEDEDDTPEQPAILSGESLDVDDDEIRVGSG